MLSSCETTGCLSSALEEVADTALAVSSEAYGSQRRI